MKQLSVFDYYQLGKTVVPLTKYSTATGNVPFKDVVWDLWAARVALNAIIQEPCALVPSSRRAVGALLRQIADVLPPDDDKIFETDFEQSIAAYRLAQIATAVANFETVMKNDMPAMAAFAVPQMGIYRTEDLIDHADNHIHEDLRQHLPELTKVDIIEGGRCLAFRVPTASAFHMSRALETVMNVYHFILTGQTFAEAKVMRNWGQYIIALRGAGAPEKITAYLDHIRKEYRNPITHPEAIVEPREAFNLFSAMLSGISQVLGAAIQKNAEQKQLAAAASAQAALPAPEPNGETK